jgi:transketolase
MCVRVWTLEGHGLPTDVGDGEKLKSLYARFAKALNQPGPIALINKRVMGPGMGELEGTSDAHEEIGRELAAKILREHGHEAGAMVLSWLLAIPSTGRSMLPRRSRNKVTR